MSRKFRFQPTLQGYAQATPEAREESHREQFTLRRVIALRGAQQSIEDLPANFFSFSTAQREADRLQVEFDDDAAPVSVYVIDSDGVPIYRGSAAQQQPAGGPEIRRMF